MDMALDQQKQQMEMMEQQQQMMQAQAGQQPGQAPAPAPGVDQAPGRTASAPGGGEGQGAEPVPPMPMQMMAFAPLKGSVNKDYTYNARGQGEPHNIDTLGEKRKSDDDPTKEPENWVEGVVAKGYLTPIIKQVSNDIDLIDKGEFNKITVSPPFYGNMLNIIYQKINC